VGGGAAAEGRGKEVGTRDAADSSAASTAAWKPPYCFYCVPVFSFLINFKPIFAPQEKKKKKKHSANWTIAFLGEKNPKINMAKYDFPPQNMATKYDNDM
jgi:hypothetical protein